MRLCLYMSSNSHMKHFPHKEHQEKCFLLTFFSFKSYKKQFLLFNQTSRLCSSSINIPQDQNKDFLFLQATSQELPNIEWPLNFTPPLQVEFLFAQILSPHFRHSFRGSVYFEVFTSWPHGRVAPICFMSTYPRGCVAAWLQPLKKTLTPIVGVRYPSQQIHINQIHINQYHSITQIYNLNRNLCVISQWFPQWELVA